MKTITEIIKDAYLKGGNDAQNNRLWKITSGEQANKYATEAVNKNELLPDVSVSDLKGFIEWKDRQSKDYLGGKFMYDIKGYYKRLNESELLDYWLERVHSR